MYLFVSLIVSDHVHIWSHVCNCVCVLTVGCR